MNGGDVVDTFVSRKNRKGVGGAFGFVRFQKECEAEKAISKNNNLVINGRKILVQLSKYARTKVAKWGDRGRSWVGKLKNTGFRGLPQSGLPKSYANAVNNTMRANPFDLEKGKNGGTSQNPKGVCLSEKDLLEGWVKFLMNRDCVEEKVVVNVGGKNVIVHSILVNSVVDSKVKEVLGEDLVENFGNVNGSENAFVDPIVDLLMNGFERQLLDDCERINGVECLFPEIGGGNVKQGNGYTGIFESSGMFDKISLEGEQSIRDVHDHGSKKGDQRVINPTIASTVSGINGDTEEVAEYNGPWAPGYLKGLCVGPVMGIRERSKDDTSQGTLVSRIVVTTFTLVTSVKMKGILMIRSFHFPRALLL